MPATAKTRGLTHVWTYRGEPEGGPPAAGGDLVSRILSARRIAECDAGGFLDPSLKHLCDPSLMPDLDRAAERILNGLAKRERVVIYGDYDVDGITATTILFHTM